MIKGVIMITCPAMRLGLNKSSNTVIGRIRIRIRIRL